MIGLAVTAGYMLGIISGLVIAGGRGERWTFVVAVLVMPVLAGATVAGLQVAT